MPPESPSARQGAFALLLVLAVLSLAVLIVVALSTHLRIEQGLSRRSLHVDQARRHALAGLALAVGRLQREAGTDRGIVAGAPITGPCAGNKTQWVGVWSPGDSGPQWLVSGEASTRLDPASPDFSNPVILVGPGSAEISGNALADPDQVRVDSVALTVPAALLPGWTASADPVVGRTAYWVGDEAGKLPVLVREDRSVITGEPPPEPSPRFDLSPLWGGYDLHTNAAQGALAKVLVYGQLGYVEGASFSAARLRRNFHRTSVASLGVLSDPSGGGLKTEGALDGSAAYGTPEAPRYDRVVYFRNPPAGTDPDDLPAARFVLHRPEGVPPAGSALSGRGAAAQLLVSGVFNLNAVSDDPAIQRERWRAVLAAARVLRFPGGVTRTLTAGEIDALASQMTAPRLRAAYPEVDKSPFTPFESLGQFARSGLLQAAIDATAINLGRNSSSADRVDQADLLALLAPVLMVRSDTFLVRAYGEVRDPLLNEKVGEAWCEAVVQRRPDYVDPADEPWAMASEPENVLLGRRLVVTSFRWLTAADL